MSSRGEILQELGLTPLWVRRDILDAWQQAANEAEQAATAVDPISVVPASASTADAPLLAEPIQSNTQKTPAPSEQSREARMILQRGQRTGTNTSAPIAPVAGVETDERARRIAAMSWDELQEAVAGCTACKLCEGRRQAVFGVGNPQAELVVVGEAPGEEEDKQGMPFVGAAGKLLDNMLAAIGEKRGERVFIANVLKCRPPKNRNPQPDEIAACAPFLARQIELIAPKALFASGRFAINQLAQDESPISALRGKVYRYSATPLVISYHPAYLLRNLPDKAKAWQDLLLLKSLLPSRD